MNGKSGRYHCASFRTRAQHNDRPESTGRISGNRADGGTDVNAVNDRQRLPSQVRLDEAARLAGVTPNRLTGAWRQAKLVSPWSGAISLIDLIRACLEAQRALTDEIQKKTSRVVPSVFHRNGKPIKDYRGAWSKACENAGLPGRIPHDFRRTAVRNLERAGVSRSVAMKMTGHKTEEIYRRYAIVSEQDLQEAARKLATAERGRVIELGQVLGQVASSSA
jgi:hypothetical protein